VNLNEDLSRLLFEVFDEKCLKADLYSSMALRETRMPFWGVSLFRFPVRSIERCFFFMVAGKTSVRINTAW
jgi:hypothetical protein